MSPYKRPEMETDPSRYPGQTVYRPVQAMYLRDIIARIKREDEEANAVPAPSYPV